VTRLAASPTAWRPPRPPGGLPDRLASEALLGLVANAVQVDAQDAEQLAVAGPWGWDDALVGQAGQHGSGRRQLHPSRLEELGGPAVAFSDHLEQEVLGAEEAVASPLGLYSGQAQDPMGLLAALDHRCYLRKPKRRPAYLWCTACLVTPGRAAICCQDQPLARAFSTCKAASMDRPRLEELLWRMIWMP
jgi:hypothetical protein